MYSFTHRIMIKSVGNLQHGSEQCSSISYSEWCYHQYTFPSPALLFLTVSWSHTTLIPFLYVLIHSVKINLPHRHPCVSHWCHQFTQATVNICLVIIFIVNYRDYYEDHEDLHLENIVLFSTQFHYHSSMALLPVATWFYGIKTFQINILQRQNYILILDRKKYDRWNN